MVSPDVAAIVLAAGRASRFGADGAHSKVYALLEGKALLAHVVATARAGRVSSVIVVTGHAAHLAAAALRDHAADVVINNAGYADGLASSLRVGLQALPHRSAGALVMLADMPLVMPSTLQALIGRFESGLCDAVVPSYRSRPGNPVLLGRSLFAAAMRLEGDEGARKLLRRADLTVRHCPVEDSGILVDVDTTAALEGIKPL